MTDKRTEKETDRYCVIIEPIFYLSEMFYEVYLWDRYTGESYMDETLDDWKEVHNHIKKIVKEYNL